MDSDFLTQLATAPSIRTFLNEILVLLLILLVKVVTKKIPETPKAFSDGFYLLLVVLMPTIAFFNVLIEIHIPLYFSVLSFVFVFVGWFAILLIKNKKIPAIITGTFIGILTSLIAFFVITYYFFR
jgi:hypothetical protein